MGRIVYTPKYRIPQEPDVDAGDYPVGSIWQSDDGSRWTNYWDSCTRAFVWSYIDPYADLNPVPKTLTYTFTED